MLATKSPFIGPAPLSQVRLFNAHPTGAMNTARTTFKQLGEGGLTNWYSQKLCSSPVSKRLALTTSIAALNRATTVQSFMNFFGSDNSI
ncbi:hypothetical protein KHA80_16735 [Anaerobacillus sp. HL2]|nr:hypothetical protein KHA80_16735 [Anaerobacillus sp. HL2]